jgi:23S rRNA pseudouridine1911/1915/1917 synthase
MHEKDLDDLDLDSEFESELENEIENYDAAVEAANLDTLRKKPVAGDLIKLVVVELEITSKAPRLDSYLTATLHGISRNRIQKLINDGQVKINSVSVRASHRVKADEVIEITIPPLEAIDVVAEDIPLSILFEDEYLAVINKPQGMVTHPGAGVYSGTLVNALLHHMRGTLSGIGGAIRPGIVHRLDKETSGLLVVAKEDMAHRHLAEQIKEKSAKRIYLALVAGHLSEASGTIDEPIGRHPVKRKQMAVVSSGRRAVTHYQVLESFDKFTLVKVQLETGRTHQIRVHMAHIGHPVVGDLVYNHGASGTPAMRTKLKLLGHALHATQLSFVHPINNRLLEFEAPLPEHFQRAIESLR